jgi:NAD(P)H-dependent FMN reductase
MSVLQIIIASTRPGRLGLPVARWFAEHAREHAGFEVQLVDLAEVALPLLDEPHHPSQRDYVHHHTGQWSSIVDAADAFVFVMPEYNYGFNAALKNAIDYLYFEWQYKPLGFVSYGNTSGGLRAVQMIKQVVTTLKMMPIPESVAIHYVGQHIEDGRFVATEAMESAAKAMLDELGRLTPALGALRRQAAAELLRSKS